MTPQMGLLAVLCAGGVAGVSFIGAVAGANSATLPTHQSGDLLIAVAVNESNNQIITLPSGWTSALLVGGSISLRVGYRTAPGSGTSSGTWTNAESTHFFVYRGASAIGAVAYKYTSFDIFIIAPPLTLNVTNGSSWVGVSVHSGVIAGPGGENFPAPSGYTERLVSTLTYAGGSATGRQESWDSNAGVTSFAGYSFEPVTTGYVTIGVSFEVLEA